MARAWTTMLMGAGLLLGAWPGGTVAAQTTGRMQVRAAEVRAVQAELQALRVELQRSTHEIGAAGFDLQARAAELRAVQTAMQRARPVPAARPARPASPGAWVAGGDALAAVPEGWLPQDPADSLYRAAREQLRERRYEQAARTFASIRTEFPRSGYVGDSFYFEALARSRLEGAEQRRRALALLIEQRREHPDAATVSDSRTLSVRIESELARQGDARAAEAVMRAAGAAADDPVGCDPEEQALRAAALSALLQMDGERARPLLHELARKPGECAAHLRTQAVFMIASSGGDDAATIDLLLDLALRDPDPSPEVRRAAVQWLAQSRRPEAIDGLLQILRAGQEGSELTHLLVSTLGQSRDPRAGEVLREVATDPAADASLRRVAIIWLARHDVRADGQLLRSLYEELDDPALKQAVFHALTSAHSPGVTEWLQARALDPDEDIEIRTNALFRAAEAGLTAAQLLDIYRGSTHPELRRQAIFALTLNDRGEGGIEALLEIARTETDPDLRRQVIFWLGQSKDPRAADFLMELLRGGGGS